MTTIKNNVKKTCEVCENENPQYRLVNDKNFDNFHTKTIENKEMVVCSQCVDHIQGNDQKLSDLEAISKKCHGHKAEKQRMSKNRRNQKSNKKSKSTEKFRY